MAYDKRTIPNAIAIADRVGTLLGREAVFADRTTLLIEVYGTIGYWIPLCDAFDGMPRLIPVLEGLSAGECPDVEPDRPEIDLDIPADDSARIALGVETVARCIVAAIKRYERERAAELEAAYDAAYGCHLDKIDRRLLSRDEAIA